MLFKCIKLNLKLLITTDADNPVNQSELARSRRQARENACELVTIGFVLLLLIGRSSGTSKCSNAKPKLSQNYLRHSIKNRSIYVLSGHPRGIAY